MRNTSVALCLLMLCSLGCGKCGGGEIDPGDATVADLVGVWNGAIPEAERVDERSRLVLELSAAANADQLPTYTLFGESIVGARQPRPGLQISQQGSWSVEDGEVIWVPDDGGQVAAANEIYELSADAMVLQSAASTKGRISYERVPLGCPDPDEHDGWSATHRQVMASGMVDTTQGFTQVVLDSKGRPHIIGGGIECIGYPCEGRPLPTTYFTRTDGCRWQGYSFGLSGVQTKLLIDSDDTLHLLGRSETGFVHFTASAEAAMQDATAWTQVPTGPLSTNRVDFGEPQIDAVIDAEGTIWLIEPVRDAASQPRPRLYANNGAGWTEIGELQPGRADLSLVDGKALVSVQEEATSDGMAVLKVFEPTDLETPVRELSGPSCVVADLQLDGDEVHVACTITTRVDVGGLHDYAHGYLHYDGSEWTMVQLGPGKAHGLMRRGDEFAVVGETVWWKEDGIWRAPGPAFPAGEDVAKDLHGVSRATAAWDAANGILHYAGQTWYAWHDGFHDATSTISLSFDGAGGGRIYSEDGLVDCSTDCEVEVPAGALVRLLAEPDATSSFVGLRSADGGGAEFTALVQGGYGVWATGEGPHALVATFDEGAAGDTAEFANIVNVLVETLDDGSMVVAGGFQDGFAPQATPLTPMAGQMGPFLMGLAPDLSVRWFNNLDQGSSAAVVATDLGDDGTLIVGARTPVSFGGTPTTADGFAVVSIDPETGAVRWETVVEGATGLDVAALPGGGAAVAITGGTRVLDPTGAEVGAISLTHDSGAVAAGPLFDASSTAVLNWDGFAVQAHDAAGTLLWSSSVGGPPGHVAGDGLGGAWVASSLQSPGDVPSCTVDDGASPLFHFDATGTCVFRGSGGNVFRGGAYRPDGTSALVGSSGTGSGLSLWTQAVGGEPAASPIWPSDPGIPPHAEWSPDGSRVGFCLGGIVGTVRYQ